MAYKRVGSTINYLEVKHAKTTIDVTGLRKYTQYGFQVLAFTVKDGPLSKPMQWAKTSEDGKCKDQYDT